MSDNTTNSVSSVELTAPPPSPAVGPPNLEEETQEEAGEEGTSNQAFEPTVQTTNDDSSEEDVGPVTETGIPDSPTPANAIRTIADNTFNFFVGPTAECFTIDINDLRRESRLFRDIPCITSVELRRESPEAVELIYNWFNGHVGDVPITKEERDLFTEAARIAGDLRIEECEAQMMVIVNKTNRALADMYEDLVDGRIQQAEEEIAANILDELEGYMHRSQNQGGGDSGESDEE